MSPRNLIFILSLLLILPIALRAQSLIISEFSADSSRELTRNGEPAEGTFPDEDGEFSDWIEVQNLTSEPQNLGNWALTDDPADLAKWQFPGMEVPPLGYVVVFASGKDRSIAGSELHTNFRINAGGEYLALVEPDGSTVASSFGDSFPPQDEGVSYGRGTLSLPMPATFLDFGADCRWLVPDETATSDWNETTFDDATWMPAKTAIGFESNDELLALIGEGGNVRDAMRGVNASIYVRIPFEIVEPAAVTSMILQMQYDDGFVAYLNGERVASVNAPAELGWDVEAPDGRSGDDEKVLEEFSIDFQGKLVAGTNVLGIHGMNSSAGGSDLMLRPKLSGEIVDVNLPTGDRLPRVADTGTAEFSPALHRFCRESALQQVARILQCAVHGRVGNRYARRSHSLFDQWFGSGD